MFDDYGQSWDEYFNYEAGRRAFESYRSGGFLRDQEDDYYHGTFYFMFYYLVPKVLTAFYPAWLEADLRHLLNFTTFILAVYSIHYIARKFFNPRTALLVALLFASQPLIVGHAFINQKDTPFMAFFLASMATGLSSIKEIGASPQSVQRGPARLKQQSPITVINLLVDKLRQSSRTLRILLLVTLFLILLLAIDLVIPRFLLPIASRLLSDAYHGKAPKFLQTLFTQIATDSQKTPLILYMEKLGRAVFWIETSVLIVCLKVFRKVVLKWHQATPQVKRDRFKSYGSVFYAGIILGLSLSIRPFAIFAGGLITFYMIYPKRKTDLKMIFSYWIIAFLTCYITWPALWGNPIAKFSARLSQTINFEPHNVIFRGELISSNSVPWNYLPELFFRQFTEPLLIGILIGVILLATNRFRIKLNRGFILIVLFWFFIPIFAQFIFRFSIYGNFRQLLFVTPPIFFLSAGAWDWILRRINLQFSSVLIFIIFMLPLVFHVFIFHPYEYIYYNYVSGGVTTADGEYAMDYWCTSYREAVEWVNANAPLGSKMRIYGPDVNAVLFGRADIEIIQDWKPSESADYQIVCNTLLPLSNLSEENRVFRVERQGVEFSVVYED